MSSGGGDPIGWRLGTRKDMARTETDIYGAAGLSYVPLPLVPSVLEVPVDLVGTEHLRGDLHLHSHCSRMADSQSKTWCNQPGEEVSTT